MFDNGTDKIFKFNSDGSLNKSVNAATSSYSGDIRHDNDGNIYIGTGSGIYKYDSNLTLLKNYTGVDAERIAIKNITGATEVYYINYRSPAMIYRIIIQD